MFRRVKSTELELFSRFFLSCKQSHQHGIKSTYILSIISIRMEIDQKIILDFFDLFRFGEERRRGRKKEKKER